MAAIPAKQLHMYLNMSPPIYHWHLADMLLIIDGNLMVKQLADNGDRWSTNLNNIGNGQLTDSISQLWLV